MKIYISNQIPNQIRENLPQNNVTYLNSPSITESDYSQIEVAWGLDATVKDILNQNDHRLKWIQSFSAGVDYFPKEQIASQNIMVTNTSGVHSVAIANTTLLYALFFNRDLNLALDMRNQKQWNDKRNYNQLGLLTKKRWLIFGTGHIGSEIAREVRLLGGTTVGVNHTGHSAENFDSTVSDTNYDSELKKADIVVNILPLTDETHHMFNADFFEKLDHLFLFINVGRGPSVNTADLIDALDSGRVEHAALDVFEEEPLPSSSPLWNYKQVLITPHNSSVSSEMLPGVKEVFLTNLKSFLKDGKPSEKIVDLSKGY